MIWFLGKRDEEIGNMYRSSEIGNVPLDFPAKEAEEYCLN
jgi:hypothetical protein